MFSVLQINYQSLHCYNQEWIFFFGGGGGGQQSLTGTFFIYDIFYNVIAEPLNYGLYQYMVKVWHYKR